MRGRIHGSSTLFVYEKENTIEYKSGQPEEITPAVFFCFGKRPDARITESKTCQPDKESLK